MARLRVCRVTDLAPGHKTIVPVGKFGIGVFNVSGALYALSNYCPHRGAPICLGWITGTTIPTSHPYERKWVRDGEILRCPWHGWEFDITTGGSLVEPRRRLRSYPVVVEKDEIYLEVPDTYIPTAGTKDD